MLTRRNFCTCLLAAIPLATKPAFGEAIECTVFTDSRQSEITPREAIERLKQGNDRFATGHSINCDLMRQVQETAAHQAPFAAIVGCIDSRVPPEIIFDQRIGDVFCARVAGNFVNDDILGSLEYATEVAGAKAIVILGHNSCGAIKSAVDNVKIGHITNMLAHISPAIENSSNMDGPHSSKNHQFVQKVAEENVLLTAGKLPEQSELIRKRVEAGTLTIVSALHDVHTGRVAWL